MPQLYQNKRGDIRIKSTCAESAHMGSLGVQRYRTEIYNLDTIISVGNRVRSKRSVLFRRWANKVLKDYLIQGYVVNQRRKRNRPKWSVFLQFGAGDGNRTRIISLEG